MIESTVGSGPSAPAGDSTQVRIGPAGAGDLDLLAAQPGERPGPRRAVRVSRRRRAPSTTATSAAPAGGRAQQHDVPGLGDTAQHVLLGSRLHGRLAVEREAPERARPPHGRPDTGPRLARPTRGRSPRRGASRPGRSRRSGRAGGAGPARGLAGGPRRGHDEDRLGAANGSPASPTPRKAIRLAVG